MKGRRSSTQSSFPGPFVIGLILLFYIPSSECNAKPVIFNFGDSNSGTGTFVIMHGMLSQLPQSVNPFLGSTSPGHMCDGRLILDFLYKYYEIKLRFDFFFWRCRDHMNDNVLACMLQVKAWMLVTWVHSWNLWDFSLYI